MSSTASHTTAVSQTKQALLRHETPTRSASQRQSALARANAIHAAAREGRPDFLLAAADARISATEAYDTAARDCIQIHGGIGVTWEAGLHLHMRRTRSLAIELGNMLFWEDLLVDQLTGTGA